MSPKLLLLPALSFRLISVVAFGLLAGCNEHRSPVDSMENNPRSAARLIGTKVPSSDREVAERIQELPETDSLSSSQNTNAPQPNSGSSDPRPPLLAVRLHDNTVFGVPIGLFSDRTLLMKSDGSIQHITNADIVQQAVLKDRFQAIGRNELARQLRAEFGKNYLVRSENPYLIVARSEHLEGWAQRFRSLYHSFNLYCSTHGLATREIEFPLVAVVFGSRSEFIRFANTAGIKLPEFCVGYYFIDSNRILLYESTDMSKTETQITISHEATHQLAFNMGLHQRRASTPLWLIEGLATMFESPRLSGLQSRDGKSLWPASRKSTWQALSKHPPAVQRMVTALIHGDSPFETDFENAYTVSWAMTTYLSQRQSQQFATYLQQVGNMPPFQEYDASHRVGDFQRTFDTDARLLTSKLVKHLETLD